MSSSRVRAQPRGQRDSRCRASRRHSASDWRSCALADRAGGRSPYSSVLATRARRSPARAGRPEQPSSGAQWPEWSPPRSCGGAQPGSPMRAASKIMLRCTVVSPVDSARSIPAANDARSPVSPAAERSDPGFNVSHTCNCGTRWFVTMAYTSLATASAIAKFPESQRA